MLVYNTSPMAAGILSKPLVFDKKCGEKTRGQARVDEVRCVLIKNGFLLYNSLCWFL